MLESYSLTHGKRRWPTQIDVIFRMYEKCRNSRNKLKLEVFSKDISRAVYGIIVEQSGFEVYISGVMIGFMYPA